MPTGKCRLESQRGVQSGLPATSTAGLTRRAASLLRELALGVTGLLGDQRAAVRAGLAVELAGAGRVMGVCHIAYT